MTKREIIKYLVKECHHSFEQILALNDDQIKTLCLPDRKS